MKKFNLCGVAAAALMLLTSCLGDDAGSMKQNWSGLLGVVRTSDKNFKQIVRTSIGDVYNEEIINKGFALGDCIQFNCLYDSSNPNNANDYSNGYTYVTVTGEPALINKVNIEMIKADTTKLLSENEFVLENPIAKTSLGVDFAPSIDGVMFLTSSYKGLSEQKNEWHMYYDMAQQPVRERGYNTYTFFLRAEKVADGKTPSSLKGQLNAYPAKHILEHINSKEYSDGNKKFNIRIAYLKTINENDRTDLEWDYSTPIQFEASKK